MRRNLVLLLVLAFVVVGAAFAGAPVPMKRTTVSTPDFQQQHRINELDTPVWEEDFEGDVSDWIQTSPQIQPNYWQTSSWMPHAGSNSWRCFSLDYGDPTYGGYTNDWLQFMITSDLDFSAVTTAQLRFYFRAYCEDGNWDGCNVWVYYGNDPNNLTGVIATPVSPAYTETDLYAFDQWFNPGDLHPGWAGQGNEPFCDTYQLATFNLNAYAGYSHVKLVIAFSSDPAYNSADNNLMFGYQVDDIVVEDLTARTIIWADDADGNNVGGAPTFLTGALAAGQDVLNYQVQIDTCPVAYQPAPSPTEVCGVFSDVNAPFDHYIEGPVFNLDPLDPGESYWLDLQFNSDIEYTNAFPAEFYWRPEVFNPNTNNWSAAGTTGNWVYVGGNGSIWEPFSTSGYTYDWDMSAYAGMNGVRLRLYFHSPAEPRTMTHHLTDDWVVDLQSLQHDISTVMVVPYPTSVGTNVYGKVYLTNNAPNNEAGFTAVWDLNGLIYPLVPGGPYSLNAYDTLELSIDDPTDPIHVGFWVPGAAGALALNAYHTLGTDEIPDNDQYPVDVDVLAANSWEVGTDSRNFFGLLSAGHLINEGPVVHIDPTAVNPAYFPNGSSFDFTQLRMDGFFHSAAGGAPANCQVQFRVYAGGATPGALVYSGNYTYPQAPGYLGYAQAVLDVSAVPALDGYSGDFWLECRLITPGLNGYMQPFPYQTGANDNQDTQFYTYDDAVAGTNLTTYGHHVTAVVNNVQTAPAILDLIPVDQTVPPGGGNIVYNIHLQTFVGQSFNGVDYWNKIRLPNGNMYPQVVFQQSFNVTPFMNVTVNNVAFQVPGVAPNGIYTFYGYVGFLPNQIYLTDSFQFQKGNVPDGGDEIGQWSFSPINFNTAGEGAEVVTLPSEYALSQAYPNPFNPTTVVNVSLPEDSHLQVTVFNVMGQQVAQLANGGFKAGVHSLTFDGAGLSSGVYFVQAEVPGQLNQLRKVTLMK